MPTLGALAPPGQRRTVTLSPGKADAYAACPLHYRHEYQGPRRDAAAPAIERGRYIHALVERHNRARLGEAAPAPPDILRLLAQIRPPSCFLDGGEREQAILDEAAQHLAGYAHFLDEQGLSVRAAERYIRTPERPVRGVDAALLVLSGRVDAVAARGDTLIALDVKTGLVPSAEHLAALPGTFIYAQLVAYAYAVPVDEVEVLQVNPRTGQWSGARLTAAQREDAARVCRSMVSASAAGAYPAIAGAHCAYCGFVARCPAHRRRPGWDGPF